MATQRIYLWDLPTRLFHWLLLAAFVAAFITGQVGGNLIVWHGRLGVLILALVVFRLVWGLIGSTYARFSQFVAGPGAIARYLRGQWQGIGHNPLGALSVMALLALLATQVGTGLFANDDIAFTGPLYALVDAELSNRLTGVHKFLSDVLLGLVGLHVLAVAYYRRIKKHDLLTPMVTGWKNDAPAHSRSAQGGGIVAFATAALVAGAVAWAVGSGWLGHTFAPPPPPPAATETPSW